MSSYHTFFPLERYIEGVGTGVWDYACDADGEVFIAGYCAGWLEETAETISTRWGAHLIEKKLEHQEQRRKYFAKYHTDGHPTPQEACLCHREYMLDQELLFTLTSEQVNCAKLGCTRGAQFRSEFIGVRTRYFVCAFHADRHTIDQLLPMECIENHNFNF